VKRGGQGRVTIQICRRHIRYYDFTLHDIKKQRTFTHGDVVIMRERVQKWKEDSLKRCR